MSIAIKSVSIRIEEKMLNKLSHIADYEGRSVNSQVLVLIRQSIRSFEDANGAKHIPFLEREAHAQIKQAVSDASAPRQPVLLVFSPFSRATPKEHRFFEKYAIMGAKENALMELKDHLKRLRKERGLTQAELAERLFVSRSDHGRRR